MNTRDHGGNLDQAMARFGGTAQAWIDLSTGINRVPYPVGRMEQAAWTSLPTTADHTALVGAARTTYRIAPAADVVPVAGAQAAIQMIPRLLSAGRAKVLRPSYNEHGASLRAAGWQVSEHDHLSQLYGADLAVLVNPNNPDGRSWSPAQVMDLRRNVGVLVVDESFADPVPEQSVAPLAGAGGLYVLRSFGKFYGLAGVRLGFVLGAPEDIAPLAEMAGPWPVAGPALQIGRVALQDRAWQDRTTARLARETVEIDGIARAAGWSLVGGASLFRLYVTPNARAAQDHLARHHIWSRIFPYSQHYLRLGLPGDGAEWARLAAACRLAGKSEHTR